MMALNFFARRGKADNKNSTADAARDVHATGVSRMWLERISQSLCGSLAQIATAYNLTESTLAQPPGRKTCLGM